MTAGAQKSMVGGTLNSREPILNGFAVSHKTLKNTHTRQVVAFCAHFDTFAVVAPNTKHICVEQQKNPCNVASTQPLQQRHQQNHYWSWVRRQLAARLYRANSVCCCPSALSAPFFSFYDTAHCVVVMAHISAAICTKRDVISRVWERSSMCAVRKSLRTRI